VFVLIFGAKVNGVDQSLTRFQTRLVKKQKKMTINLQEDYFATLYYLH